MMLTKQKHGGISRLCLRDETVSYLTFNQAKQVRLLPGAPTERSNNETNQDVAETTIGDRLMEGQQPLELPI
jgi:hypothetical protein